MDDGQLTPRHESEEKGLLEVPKEKKGLLAFFNKRTAAKKKEVHVKNADFSRVMSYYKPVCSAVTMVLCACINSLSFPILGLLISFY